VIKLLVTASQFHSEFLVRLRTHLSVSPFRWPLCPTPVFWLWICLGLWNGSKRRESDSVTLLGVILGAIVSPTCGTQHIHWRCPQLVPFDWTAGVVHKSLPWWTNTCNCNADEVFHGAIRHVRPVENNSYVIEKIYKDPTIEINSIWLIF
jgi:hypothetical protein